MSCRPGSPTGALSASRPDAVLPLDVTMFSSGRSQDGVGYHLVASQSDRLEASRQSYVGALELADRVAMLDGRDVRRRMEVGGTVYLDTPLSRLQPGMTVLVEGDDGQLVDAAVDLVVQQSGDALVYDLEVADMHNYIADGLVVHNSVYRFRGADISNILEFEEAFPDATVILLEQNYRSTQTILDAANAVIANNTSRKPKQLWTEVVGGELIKRFTRG